MWLKDVRRRKMKEVEGHMTYLSDFEDEWVVAVLWLRTMIEG
jgi:hypothetical protein